MKRILMSFLSLWLAGCSHMLPKVQSELSTFKTFDEARAAIDSLRPTVSTVDTLKQMDIDPTRQPNTVVLTQQDIAQKFLSGNTLKREDLDPGVLACLDARNACQGLAFTAERMLRARTGGFLADFTNFKRRTETTGWRFSALILLVNDVVVYRTWGGQPKVEELEVRTNPLGPLQEMGPALITR